MNKDIRVAVDFFVHPKTIKMERALGDASPGAFIRLLTHAAVNKPSGVLSGMDAEDVAIAAGWKGEAEAYVEALLRVGYLERMGDGTLAIHDWLDHNPYAASSEERSQKARRAAHKRHHGTTEHSDEQTGAMLNPASSMRLASPGNAPSPSPSPSPSPDPSLYQNQNHLPPTPNAHASAHEASASAEVVGETSNIVAFPSEAERVSATEPEAPPVAAPPPSREPEAKYSPDFERFWSLYPKKEGKYKAQKRFSDQRRHGFTLDQILEGLARWKASERWARGYVKDAEGWLNGRMFLDEPEPVRAAETLPAVANGGRPAQRTVAEVGRSWLEKRREAGL